MEAFAYGISVVIIENPSGLIYDPVPKDIPKDLFIKCKSSEELRYAIKHFLSYSPDKLQLNKKIGNQIRGDYFEPITKEGINTFLNVTYE